MGRFSLLHQLVAWPCLAPPRSCQSQQRFGTGLASACSQGWSPSKPGMPNAARLPVHTSISACKSPPPLVRQAVLPASGPLAPSCEGMCSGSTTTSLPGWHGSRKPPSTTSAEAERAPFSFGADSINPPLILLFAVTRWLPRSKVGQPWRCCLTAGGLFASTTLLLAETCVGEGWRPSGAAVSGWSALDGAVQPLAAI